MDHAELADSPETGTQDQAGSDVAATYSKPVSLVGLNIDGNGSRYGNEERLNAVTLYLQHGNGALVSRHSGIPETTISLWRKTDWWDDAVALVRSQLEDSTRAKLQAIAHKGMDEALARLEHGETVHTKDGPKQRPVNAKDAMLVASIAYDKLRLSLNLPGRITGDGGKIDGLAAQLAQLSGQVNAKTVHTVDKPSPQTSPQTAQDDAQGDYAG